MSLSDFLVARDRAENTYFDQVEKEIEKFSGFLNNQIKTH